MGTINSSDRIAAPLYSLGTWFVSGICVYVYTLHKGDSDDYDDYDNNNNNLYYVFDLSHYRLIMCLLTPSCLQCASLVLKCVLHC
jgi:hypothetical protein